MLKELKPRKALNKAFLKVKPNRTEIEGFKTNLITLLDRTNDTESEEFHKNLVSDFLKKTYYDPNHFINTKGRNDLVIHNGQNANSTVGVILEAKKPTNKAEMITTKRLNAKAFQELVLYYLRERITHKNLEVKHLVATNINEWFIFDENLFERLFAQNKSFVRQFENFEASKKTTDVFYKEIAEPFIAAITAEIEFTYFNLQDYTPLLRGAWGVSSPPLLRGAWGVSSPPLLRGAGGVSKHLPNPPQGGNFEDNPPQGGNDNSLIALFKILSPEHLLKLPFINDSNSLDKRFYSELLHIIGLTETKEGSKKLIGRNKAGERNTGTILESAIIQLESLDKLSRLEKPNQFGNTQQERLFNVALELSITWINRILFLKLLEAQLITYHKTPLSRGAGGVSKHLPYPPQGGNAGGASEYKFLNLDKIQNYDDLNSLFFQVLARKHDERNEDVKKIFEKVPYLNSSLFEPTDIEQDTLFISNLKDDKTIPIFSQTVLKDQQGKKRTGNISTLQYLLEFLDAYDFGAEGGEEIQEDNKTLINASVLGLIFEKINGYKDGSFFTPGFITMYMCRETIRKAVVQKFDHAFPDFGISRIEDIYDLIPQKISRKKANEIVNSLKICDPAVGSGHFLVSALNEIIAVKNDLKILEDREGKSLHRYEVEVVNDELIVTDEEGELFEYHPGSTGSPANRESQRVQEALFHEKQTIIENCLFGVDINSNSVKICRLRLWIELLKNAYYIRSSSPNYSPPYEGGVAQRAGVVEQLNNLPHLKTFRKELRNNLTPAEAKLWTLLKGKQMAGRKFRRQHSVANYILDFYCPEERIAIELDGQGHFEATQAEYDREREVFLETVGIRVLRFENKWVWDNPEGLLETIKSYFGKQHKSSPPNLGGVPEGGGGYSNKPPQSSSPDKGRWSQTGGVNFSTQPPQSSSPDKGRWSQTGGVNFSTQPPQSSSPDKGRWSQTGGVNNSTQPPQSSSPDKGRWSQTGGVNFSTQPPRPADTPPYKGGELLELQTLPNIDINIKCGNSLVSRFAIDADLKQALKKSKWTIDSYRLAVATYRNAESKEQKREMERLIAGIKSDFRSEISSNDPKVKKLRKLSGDLYQMTNQGQLFEMSQKEKADWNKRVQQLTQEISKWEAEIEEIKTNKIFENAFEWRFEFPEVLNDDGDFVGFDVVIGNPPYFSMTKLKEQSSFFENAGYQTYSKSADIYCLFYEKGIQLLKGKGILTFITSNSWLRTQYGQLLRKYLVEKANPLQLINIEDRQIFDDATVESNIIEVEKSEWKSELKATSLKSDFNLSQSLTEYFKHNCRIISSLPENGWTIGNEAEGNLKAKIENQGVLLKDLDYQILRGFTTGFNEAFFMTTEKRDELIKKDSYNNSLIKKALRGKDISKYNYVWKDIWVLLIKQGMTNEQNKGNHRPEDFFSNKYPSLYKHLKEIGDSIKGKGKGLYARDDQGDYWWELRPCVYYEEFEKPKIVWGELSDSQKFAYDESGIYANNTIFFITGNDLKYLLSILNSKVAKWYFNEISTSSGMGTNRWLKYKIELLPIVQPSSKEKNAVEKLAQNILYLKQQNPSADTTALESQIDQLVYQLYGLTEEEIANIESSNK